MKNVFLKIFFLMVINLNNCTNKGVNMKISHDSLNIIHKEIWKIAKNTTFIISLFMFILAIFTLIFKEESRHLLP